MRQAERLSAILERLSTDGAVDVSDLVRWLGVSPATARPFLNPSAAPFASVTFSSVSLPSPVIRRAVAWGKVGSRRVWHRYGTGDWGFTNDPPGNTVVTRDAAWFVFGADRANNGVNGPLPGDTDT